MALLGGPSNPLFPDLLGRVCSFRKRKSNGVEAEDAIEESNPARGAIYLFSKEDRMINWADIEEHAEEARRKGWTVKEVLFEGSGHCAHVAMDERRYIGTVNSVWRGNGDGSEVLVA